MHQNQITQAFLKATLKEVEAGKVDHQRGTGNWVARRVALQVLNEPPKPKGTIKRLDKATQNIITETICDIAETLQASRAAGLEDAEVLGLD